MLYVSTRGNCAPATGSTILLEGLAPDGGLRMPMIYSQLDLKKLRGKSFHHVAFWVLHRFFPEVPKRDMWGIVRSAFSEDAFGSPEITPTTRIGVNLFKLELSNGPTCAFKDIALRFVAAFMEYVLVKSGKKCNIVVATSGDTGKAALAAFAGKQNITITVLTPFGRMSSVQALQTYTFAGDNVQNLAIEGTFDDCQALVKAMFNDAASSSLFSLGAVNSINWARIAAQTVYFVYSYLQVTKSDTERVTNVISSGNGGHFVAGHVAQQMGLPISIIVATNENDVLHQYFQTGHYRARPSSEVIATTSPSMNIAVSSNFERYMFETTGRNAAQIAEWFGSKQVDFTYGRDKELLHTECRFDISSGMVTMREVDDTIWRMYDVYGELVDPHTAVGMHVALQHRARVGMDEKIVVAETALPCMFPETMREALGFTPPLPAQLQALVGRGQVFTRLPNDLEAVKDHVRALATAA